VSPSGTVPVLDQGKSGVIGYHNNQPGVIASPIEPVIVFANHTCYMRLIPFSFSAIQNVLPFRGKAIETIWTFYATYDKQSFIEYKGHWPDFVIIKIVKSKNEVAKCFAQQVRPLLFWKWKCEQEITNLNSLRDALLPKLISGEIEVPINGVAE
jgi:type I restriction enzyme, S subunit